jgi:hypothetical protein
MSEFERAWVSVDDDGKVHDVFNTEDEGRIFGKYPYRLVEAVPAPPGAELAVYKRAFELAVNAGISAIDGCDCAECEVTREQMRDYWLERARLQVASEQHGADEASD